jgi:hypothetical protein
MTEGTRTSPLPRQSTISLQMRMVTRTAPSAQSTRSCSVAIMPPMPLSAIRRERTAMSARSRRSSCGHTGARAAFHIDSHASAIIVRALSG